MSIKPLNHPGFETRGESHTKSKIGAINGPTKWTMVQQKFNKKSLKIRHLLFILKNNGNSVAFKIETVFRLLMNSVTVVRVCYKI